MGTASVLRATEREFFRLTPDPLQLRHDDIALGLPEPTMGLVAVRDLLLSPDTGVALKDQVWRVVIGRARLSGEWMVAAMGLGMPALRAVARRCSRGLTWEQTEEVEAEVAASFVAEVRRINTDYAQLAWYLRCRAQRGGLRARKSVLAAPVAADPEAELVEAPDLPSGHPDYLLEAAVQAGVISAEEADLIGTTRLEKTSLRDVAAARGHAYWALAKRRSRAEERLVAAVTSGGLKRRNSPLAPAYEQGNTANAVPPVSKSAWGLAL